jgi:AraC-like DNA-binding protein
MIDLAANETDRGEGFCSRGEPAGGTSVGRSARGVVFGATQSAPSERGQLMATRRIEASVQYMLQHLNQPIRVSRLSAMAGLSDSSYFALFKRATGQTPLGFFIRARMQRAGELLTTSTLQVKEVAAQLGYEDQFYFSRLFKSVHGLPPRAYRVRKAESHLPAPPHKPHAGERVVSERFCPVAQRATVFRSSRGESSPQPDQTCSRSVHP